MHNSTILALGAATGSAIFIAGTLKIGGIFYRPNSEGNKEFTISIFKDYIVTPFKIGTPSFKAIWGIGEGLTIKERLALLQLNWVVTVSAGIATSIGIIATKCCLF
jgi:hypothetical protein